MLQYHDSFEFLKYIYVLCNIKININICFDCLIQFISHWTIKEGLTPLFSVLLNSHFPFLNFNIHKHHKNLHFYRQIKSKCVIQNYI